MRVVVYARVSTDKDDQANSFVAQQQYFVDYIDRHKDWDLVGIYADEGITGTSTRKRVQFNQMINDAYLGKFDLIVTKEVSRFSRNILDTIKYTRDLKAIGVGVLFATDGFSTMDADAELRLSIMGSIAQEESRKTSTRVKWGQQRSMERGVVFGRSMLGYDVKDGKMTINPDGAALVRLIYHKYGVENKGTSVIAKELREAGYLTYTGNAKWTGSQIIKILQNEKYIGDLVQKKTYTPDYLTHQKKYNRGAENKIALDNHHEPIIDRELWDVVQERLNKNNKHNGEDAGHSNRYIFSGKIKCGCCGKHFVGRYKYLRNGEKVKRWSCATATNEGVSGCNIGKIIRDDDAINMLKTAIDSLQIDRDAIIKNVSNIVLDAIAATTTAEKGSPEKIQKEIEQVQKKKMAVMDSYFSGEINFEDMQTMKAFYEKQIASLTERLGEVRQCKMEQSNETSITDDIETTLLNILTGQIESEALLKNVLDEMTVYQDRHIEVKLKHLHQTFVFDG